MTNNGKRDLAVINIEAYEQLQGQFELYNLISEGMRDIEDQHTRPFSDAMADLKAKRKSKKTESTAF
ncbi:MAG: hypothetical protein Q4B26_07100 [Eubacteriales bacterium]|nr:hypothetical protein [Eubacteriales bacterium]